MMPSTLLEWIQNNLKITELQETQIFEFCRSKDPLLLCKNVNTGVYCFFPRVIGRNRAAKFKNPNLLKFIIFKLC